MSTLREIREEYYISRKTLADLANVSESTIVRIEEASHKTTYQVAQKIVAALSQQIGKDISIKSIEGLNLYNPMRDRKLRTKAEDENAVYAGYVMAQVVQTDTPRSLTRMS